MGHFQPGYVGRMSHSAPALQDMPNVWTDTLTRVREQVELCRSTGSFDWSSVQNWFKVGDLVAWAPLTKVGLWRVVEIPPPKSFMEADYSQIELRLAAAMAGEWKTTNPCGEVKLGSNEESDLKPLPDVAVVEWVAGACGPVSNIGERVEAPIADLRRVTEMEVLAIAASE
jgi:hypothetical protein